MQGRRAAAYTPPAPIVDKPALACNKSPAERGQEGKVLYV